MTLDELFNKIHDLPTIPKVVQELIQMFNDPNADLDKIADKISLEQVISAKVLRLANSPRFRGSQEITSIGDASSRLGMNTLRTLVMASAVTGAFKTGPSFDIKAFWLQSFQVGTIARLVARQLKQNTETAFTCGMLHDIGELLIQVALPDVAESINKASGGTEEGRREQENLQLGFSFTHVGAELAKRWKFPTAMQEAIEFQFRHREAPEGNAMPKILAIANQVQRGVVANGLNDECKAMLGDLPVMRELDMDKLFEDLPAALEADKSFAEMLS
ncbi:HDOD domain-containing protein [Atopomonas sediminilitoris]|uniref:HDOD domain-containing protein n=1 Tax=Atopomonas sediminilitoris TaxID=2919919 RepID=UPI001F4E34A5|nr:HDOD domain-containing protein [Atopomonas sediminilitoris]MCJ8170113.1 HDOD domain-containing protein [Atopomonas sediminilitoris]